MAQPSEKPNPERRSDAALLCLFIGFGLMGLAWFLGLGGVIAAAASGGANPAAMAGGMAALILLPLAGALGFLFVLVGGIWLVIRVIADQAEANKNDRYSRDVER